MHTNFPPKSKLTANNHLKYTKLDGSEEKIVQLRRFFFRGRAYFQMEGMMGGWGPHLPKNSWENGMKLKTLHPPCCWKKWKMRAVKVVEEIMKNEVRTRISLHQSQLLWGGLFRPENVGLFRAIFGIVFCFFLFFSPSKWLNKDEAAMIIHFFQ